MSRKDYIKIADVLKEIPEDINQDSEDGQANVADTYERSKRYIVTRFSNMLADDNPRFNRSKFINYINEDPGINTKQVRRVST